MVLYIIDDRDFRPTRNKELPTLSTRAMSRGVKLGIRAIRRLLSRPGGRSRMNLMMKVGRPLVIEGMWNLTSRPAVPTPVCLDVGSLVCSALDDALNQEEEEDEPR